MRVLIIGNGVAGTMAAKTLRELEPQVEIGILSDEKYPYYPRPNLIEYLAGQRPQDKMFAFPEDWNIRQRIEIKLSTPVIAIDPEKKEIELSGGKKEKFDYLLLAVGARASRPPLKGIELSGVFTLRTLDDAIQILDYLTNCQHVVVIGGGLLGLEIARALKMREVEVTVIEFFDRLLPRQLDPVGANLLQRQIEAMGIKVLLGQVTEEILGQGQVKGVRLKSGQTIEAQMVLIAAGIKPNLELAQMAGLKINKGVLVDDYLKTSHPSIFAAGDLVEHRGRLYGIIPAAFDQARSAAYNLLGQIKPYEGTVPSNSLKVMGISLTSVGLIQAEGEDYEELAKIDEERGLYKKIILQKGRLVGAIWMGTKKGINEIVRAVTLRKDVTAWKEAILEEDFNFSLLNSS
ncbi:MAG: FAD-dependent oxidoreductase [Candidatus Aminicenantes bacterium]|nr:FAD-dependent oxidoreductase [Candidatus Aminicenantes bacterium]